MQIESGHKLDPKIMTLECPSCGGDCKMSVTKNRTIHTWCTHKDESGEKCGYRAFIGRVDSRKIINEYKNQLGAKQHAEQIEINEQQQNIEHTPRAEREGNPEREVRSGSGAESPEPANSGSGIFGKLGGILAGAGESAFD